MTNIRLEDVSASYSSKERVLHQFSLEVDNGELVVIAGPSGCGKTTLLRVVAGLKAIDAGKVYFDGVEMSRVAPHQRNVAMVFQSDALYSHLSVEQNLTCGLRTKQSLRPKGGLRSQAQADVNTKEQRQRTDSLRIRSVADRLGIDGLFPRKPFQLSGGERQRVSLARALVREPAAFLLDEPFSDLDAVRTSDLRKYIKELQREKNKTTLFVTHSQDEAMLLADRIAVMNHGQLQQFATPEDIYNRPANLFVASFFGTPSMNFFNGRLVVVKDRCVLETVAGTATIQWEIKKEGRLFARANAGKSNGFVFGVRPEHVLLSHVAVPRGNTGVVESVAFWGRQKIVAVQVENSKTKNSQGDSRSNDEQPSCKLVAVVDVDFQVTEKDQVFISWNEDRLHTFDPETGQSV